MLGDATTGLPAPGYAVPYAFNSREISDFLNVFSKDPTVSTYLWTKAPAYGVIFNAPNGNNILLWFDASGVFHVIDVTQQPIVSAVEAPEYTSPDSSVIDNIVQQVQSLINQLPSPTQALGGLEALAVLAGIYFVYKIVRG